MSTIVAIARLLLAVVFLLAALGKLLDRPGTRQASIEFGVPTRWAAAAAICLPALELAISLSLVFQPSAEYAAIAAAGLLAAFILGIARVLRSGRAPECHCFGQFHSAPAGRATLLRNSAFFALAVAAALNAPGAALTALLSTRAGSATSFAAAVVLLTLTAWLRSRESVLGKAPTGPPHLPVGSPAPAFALQSVTGETSSLSELIGGPPLMLVFTSAICTSCQALMPELGRWQSRLAGALSIVPIAYGDRQMSLAHALEHGVQGMLFTDDDRTLIDAYAVSVTPGAILISPDGAVASAPIEGADAIDAWLGIMSYDRAPAPLVQTVAAR